MFISEAIASTGTAATTGGGAGEAFMLNMLMILILVILFYVLLIMPQQKRFKKHREMMNSLRKGDKVLTAGGFIGTIDKASEGEQEVVIDLGNKVKVTALRSTIQNVMDDATAPAAAAPKEEKDKKEDTKKEKDSKKKDKAA